LKIHGNNGGMIEGIMVSIIGGSVGRMEIGTCVSAGVSVGIITGVGGTGVLVEGGRGVLVGMGVGENVE
jgi:hypothetical protein